MQALGNGKLLRFGEFQLDADKKILRRGDEIVPLPLKAVELLCVLVENHGEVVSKDELIGKIWADSFVEDSVLTQNIYLLRKTLWSNGTKSSIKNVPRRGYVFEEPVSFGREMISESHLVEHVDIEEIEDEEDGFGEFKEIEIAAPTGVASARRAIFVFAALSTAILFSASAYFYFRAESNVTTITSSPPLKLKAISAPSSVKSLAVLPFSGSEQSFASAFSSDLSVRLGSANKFNVKSFELVNEYARNGAELTAHFVLSGDLQRRNNSFAAEVRLLDMKNSEEIWTGRFEYDNIIQLQDAVANSAARELLNRLNEVERGVVATRLPTNHAAYRNYQTGYALWRRRSDGSAYLKKAIEMDASFAPAYALLANIKATGGAKNSKPAIEAEELLQKAFALDENLADAYAVQGFIRIFHHRDWDGAEKSLKNAIELDASNINAHHWLGVYYSIHRRLDEAKAEMHRALELDPTNPTLLADIGQLHYFAGENGLAEEFVRKALHLDPGHTFANGYLTLISQPRETGSAESVLKRLDDAVAAKAFTLPYINIDPQYDHVRGDKRFQAILRKMNLHE